MGIYRPLAGTASAVLKINLIIAGSRRAANRAREFGLLVKALPRLFSLLQSGQVGRVSATCIAEFESENELAKVSRRLVPTASGGQLAASLGGEFVCLCNGHLLT